MEINQTFLDLLDKLDLSQLINFPTRAVNTLELLLTNRPSLIHEITPHPGISDHDSIFFARIDCLAEIKRPVSRMFLQWHKVTDEKLKDIRDYVSSAAQNITDTCSVDTPVEVIWQKIKNISDEVIGNMVPSKVTSKRFNQTWVTRKCRSLFRRKRRAYNRARRTNREADWNHFRDLRRETQKQCNKAAAEHIARRVSIDTDSTRKAIYSYIKNNRTDNNGVLTLVANGKSHSSPKEKADALNHQFSSVFSPVSDSVPDLGTPKAPKISDMTFNVNGVKAMIKKIQPNKLKLEALIILVQNF